MVKGLSRKIIIVKSPDPKIFEQAIFIVRDDYLMKQGIDQKELMRQANEAASGYVNKVYGIGRLRESKLLYGILGVLAIGCVVAIGFLLI